MSSSNSEIINTAAFNLCDELTTTLMRHILQLQEAEQWFERSTQRLDTARKEYEKAEIEAEEADEEAENKSERDDQPADDEDHDTKEKLKEEDTAFEICMMKLFAVKDAEKILKKARNELDDAKRQVRATQRALTAAQKKVAKTE